MIVYRICNEKEALNILENNSCDNYGKRIKTDNKKSTHCYEDDKKYMHFFKDEFSILYMSTEPNRYIFYYDIPEYLLQKYCGYGYYLDIVNFRKVVDIFEYAIPSELIKFEYIDKVYKIVSSFDYEEYIYDGLDSYVEKIYDRENNHLVRKM